MWAIQRDKDVEEDRKDLQVETPAAPSVRLLWEGRAAEVVLRFLENTKAGCIVTLRRPPEEEEGEDSESEEGGPLRMYLLLFSFLFLCFFFLCGGTGKKETGALL